MKTQVKYSNQLKKWALIIVVISFTLVINSCHKQDPVINNNKTAHLFVANENSQSISVIDAITMNKITDIDVSDTSVSMTMPHNVQVAPNGKTVWATVMGMTSTDNDQVVVIDPLTNQIIKRIYLGKDLHLAHVVLDKQCANAFVTAYEADKVFQINTSDYTIVKTFELDTSSGPHGMRYSNGKLYIADMDGKSMIIIDVTTGNISTIPLGGIAVQTAVTQNGKYAFATLYDTKEVVRYNISTKQITKISLPFDAQGPIQIYPTPNDKFLYVCDQGGLLGHPTSNKVYLIDIENASVISSIITGNKTHGVVVSNDGEFAYVTNMDDNTVSRINTSNNMVDKTASTGLEPNGIAYWYGIGGME